MSLSIAIIGLPNVGKSTLFNALTSNNILAANYPFATIDQWGRLLNYYLATNCLCALVG